MIPDRGPILGPGKPGPARPSRKNLLSRLPRKDQVETFNRRLHPCRRGHFRPLRPVSRII